MSTTNTLRIALFTCLAASLVLSSCKKKKEEVEPETTPETPVFRPTRVDYSLLTATTPYNNELFEDSNGDSTVNRTDGHNILRMVRALDAYGKTANAGLAVTVSSSVMGNMFTNTGSPFTGSYSDLNSVNQSLINYNARSLVVSQRDQAIAHFYNNFSDLAESSAYHDTAEAGIAGRLLIPLPSTTKYVVNEQGYEVIQMISKSMIGSVLLDQICNVLLVDGLNGDNTKLVAGQKYTELEHNWDVAYGMLSMKERYGMNATTTPASNGGELFLGAYAWEYNRDNYTKLHPAFLKGRAAIINNDMETVREQAAIIRGILEYAVGNAAKGYLNKWKDIENVAADVHQLSEGLGFIYSFRFCKLNGADAAFSDELLDELGIYEGNGVWDMTSLQATTAANTISTKFNLQ